jgi:hypothetical protein
MPDRFYVGYLGTSPATARRLKRWATALVVLAGAAATALAIATGPFDRATYEFTKERTWEGRLEATPLPVLIARNGAVSGAPLSGFVRFPLVAQGKHGVGAMIAGLDGVSVRFKGRRIMRQGTTMLEVVPGTIERYQPALPADGRPVHASQIDDLGITTFEGEIVDSKCFLGVMNPGRLEVHRACAIRCIAGGIPPMLFTHDAQGREAHLLLVDPNGRPINDRVLDVVARPVTIEGRLERRDDLYYLYAETWAKQ